MSMTQVSSQLHQDLQNELIITNELLRLILNEVHIIKQLTSSGGEFEANIKQNAALMTVLAKLQHINIENLLPPRTQIDLNNMNQNGQDSGTAPP